MRAKLATCALLLASAFPLHAAQLPAQGMTMTAVEASFGTPRQISGPVGRPAITRWVYDGFVVVFERNRVIRSVTVTGDAPAIRPSVAAPALMPAATPAPAPAPAAKPAEPMTAAPVNAPEAPAASTDNAATDAAEQARRAAEREAMKKARAEAAARKAENDARTNAEADTATQAAEPPVAPPTETVSPASETPPADDTKAQPAFSFDPATGRIILK